MDTSFRKLLAIVAVLLFVPAFLVISGTTLTTALAGKNVQSHDFISYWGAGQLLLRRHNPYDPVALLPLEHRTTISMVMRNPPWSLWMTLPLGLVSPLAGIRLWDLLLLLALAVSASQLHRMFGRPRNKIHLLAFCFGPAVCCMAYGQTSIFVLLGLCTFFYFAEKRPILAGAALSVCALKPHLLLCVFAAAVMWALSRRVYRLIAAFVIALGLEYMVAYAFDPAVWSEYRHTMLTSNIDHEFVPTLGVAIRHIANAPPWIQFVPMCFALCWVVGYIGRHRQDWDWKRHGAIVALVSVVCSPYAWMTDQVLFWPALLPAMYRSSGARMLLLAASGGMLLQLCLGVDIHSPLYLWPMLLWPVIALYQPGHGPSLAASQRASVEKA